MRNRLSSLDAHNKRRVDAALKALGPRVGFRLLPGLAERVIYRELFPRGLTVLDLGAAGIPMTMSHVAARSEIRTVIGAVLARAPDAGAGHRAPQAEPVLAAPGSRPSGANL